MEGARLPLHTTVSLTKTTKNINVCRALTLFRIGVVFLFFKYRLWNSNFTGFGIWALAICCETVFTLNFLVCAVLKWRPVERATCLGNLSSMYEKPGEASKLPPVDIFITTADPLKEPPIITANTILSVLAADYPAEKVACYVSDDFASPITFCMMLEVSHFGEKWVTFCNTFSVEPRAPAPVFSNAHTCHQKSDSYFEQWKALKEEYEQLKYRIESLISSPEQALKRARERIPSWPSPNPTHHPPIVQVIVHAGNKMQINGHGKWRGPPQLIYVAREKKRGYNHHFKAGALNALMRVSGILSNSPFVLNLDCDMYMNDSKALRHAMCFLMDPSLRHSVAFVQFPQVFDNLGSEDVYGNRLVFLYDILLKGLDGIQGPLYCGTGCFHRRKALYGGEPGGTRQSVRYEEYRSKLGPSPELIEYALTLALDSSAEGKASENSAASAEALLDLCSSSYEHDTSWGTEIGWRYGSSTEDVLTGYRIHCLGWRSIYFSPSRPAFKGIAPAIFTDRLVQRKRAGRGLVEIFLSKFSPLFYGRKGLLLLQRVGYVYTSFLYSGMSIFMVPYAGLHAACLLSGKTHLTPKISDPASTWFVLAFCFQIGMSFLECRWANANFGEWWNQERFWYISNASAFLFGTVEALLGSIGVVEAAFAVTPKSETHGTENGGSFALADSPLVIPLTTLVMVFVVAMLTATAHVVKGGMETFDKMFGELLCGGWCLVIMFPILRQMAERPKAISSVPVAVMLASVVLTTLFCAMVAIWVC